MLAQLRALVPGQGSPQLLGQGLHGGDQTVAHALAGVVHRQVDQHDEAGRAFDQRADR